MTIADVAIIALFAMLALLITVELVRPGRTFGCRSRCADRTLALSRQAT
jgi:hypothetical protein